MTHLFSVSVIVPVYNEEDSIAQSVLRNINVLEASQCDYEIIVVNDGSNDKSLSILEQFFAKEECVKIVHSSTNGGFGKAVRKGIEIASKEYMLCVPADSPLTEAIFAKFMANANSYDMIASYRKERLGYSWRMKLNSIVYRWLVIAIFDVRVRDFNWIHLYKRSIFLDPTFTLQSNGIFFLAEVIIQCNRRHYLIGEFEVEQEMRLTGIATASKLSSILKTIRELLHFKRTLK
ncbi:MAG: glycosyltransferase family 2 protein [Chitinophagales bacterium]